MLIFTSKTAVQTLPGRLRSVLPLRNGVTLRFSSHQPSIATATATETTETSSSTATLPSTTTATPSSTATSMASDESSQDTPNVPNKLFPTSRASLRPFPHSAPLFGEYTHDPNLKPGQRHIPQTSPSLLSKETFDIRNSVTNSAHKIYYRRLGIAADYGDIFLVLKLCQRIFEVRSKGTIDYAPRIEFTETDKIIFLCLFKVFSKQGLVQHCFGVMEDMQRCGLKMDVQCWDYILKATVVRGDAEATNHVLEQISKLKLTSSDSAFLAPPTQSSDKLSDLVFSPSEPSAPCTVFDQVLPPSYTRNWTSNTYAHMIRSAFFSHNLEYALALAAAALRDGKSFSLESTRYQLISLALHTQEFRLAIELAEASELGGIERQIYTPANLKRKESVMFLFPKLVRLHPQKVQPTLWIKILRACCDGGYLPGIELAWQNAVVKGLLVPDEGTILSVLCVAADEGSVSLVKLVLKQLYPELDSVLSSNTMHSRPGHGNQTNPLSDGTVLQEWHLAPLFRAQCVSKDFQGAIQTLSHMRRCGHFITYKSTLDLPRSIYRDSSHLSEAHQALLKVGRDAACGVDIVAVNAILSAAIWNGKMALATEIYNECWNLFDSNLGHNNDDDDGKVRPDLETFHIMFSGCIDTMDRDLGVKLLNDLNSLSLKPTPLTYERMILFSLTQLNYDDAFGFLEEAKLAGHRPSRKSYEGLIRKCHSSKDDRWRWVAEEMEEAGYFLHKDLQAELGWQSSKKPQPPTDRKPRKKKEREEEWKGERWRGDR